MFDTIVLQSPPISEVLAKILEKFCEMAMGIYLKSGEIKYQFTSGKLDGSFDSRIGFAIKREKFMDDTKSHLRTGKKTMILTPCKPYYIVSIVPMSG